MSWRKATGRWREYCVECNLPKLSYYKDVIAFFMAQQSLIRQRLDNDNPILNANWFDTLHFQCYLNLLWPQHTPPILYPNCFINVIFYWVTRNIYHGLPTRPRRWPLIFPKEYYEKDAAFVLCSSGSNNDSNIICALVNFSANFLMLWYCNSPPRWCF